MITMPPQPCEANLLDDLPDFPGTATVSGIHKSAEKLEDELELEDVVEDVVEEKEATNVAPASLPPLPMSSSGRIAGLVFGVVAAGGIAAGLFLMRPAAPARVAATSSFTVAAPPTVGVPEVSIPAVVATTAVAAAAPVETAQAAAKPPPTLADGEWMLRHGQLPRAEAIYRSILASGGSEHEALTGLGKVALYNHQSAEALSFFERALARQPQYFPARLGRADALWDAGRRDSAKAQYAAIREGYPDNSIPARIIERTRP